MNHISVLYVKGNVMSLVCLLISTKDTNKIKVKNIWPH